MTKNTTNFYPSIGSDVTGDVTYTNGNGGEYSVTWQNVGDFTAGKGWKEATGRLVSSPSHIPNSYILMYSC